MSLIPTPGGAAEPPYSGSWIQHCRDGTPFAAADHRTGEVRVAAALEPQDPGESFRRACGAGVIHLVDHEMVPGATYEIEARFVLDQGEWRPRAHVGPFPNAELSGAVVRAEVVAHLIALVSSLDEQGEPDGGGVGQDGSIACAPLLHCVTSGDHMPRFGPEFTLTVEITMPAHPSAFLEIYVLFYARVMSANPNLGGEARAGGVLREISMVEKAPSPLGEPPVSR